MILSTDNIVIVKSFLFLFLIKTLVKTIFDCNEVLSNSTHY
jgi:hypothetical protein